jgi:hypothetical protein
MCGFFISWPDVILRWMKEQRVCIKFCANYAPYYPGLSLMTGAGFAVLTLRKSNDLPKGKIQTRRDRKKVRPVKSKVKSMLITFFSSPTHPIFLFPLLKIKLKGRHFITNKVMKGGSQEVLHSLKKPDFQDAFKKWQKRWERCVCAEGDYFEGDGGK